VGGRRAVTCIVELMRWTIAVEDSIFLDCQLATIGSGISSSMGLCSAERPRFQVVYHPPGVPCSFS